MKEEILSLAEKQMKIGGYESLSFREIAEELSISKANVHHHFKNKEALAIEVANHYASEHLQQMDEVAIALAPDYIQFLNAVSDNFWKEAFEFDNCALCVCAQLTREASIPKNLLDVAQGHFVKVIELFQKHAQISIDAGILRSDLSAHSIALQTGIIFNGVMSVAQGMPSVEIAHKLLDGQMDTWIEGLKAK